MKKIYISTIALALVSANVAAQQLPNAGFEEGWTDCIPWTFYMNEGDQNGEQSQVVAGTEPEGWCVSSVAGMASYNNGDPMGLGTTLVGEKAEEGFESATAVKLTNTPNPFMSSQIVPAYLTLGTSWSTANPTFSFTDGITINSADGGSFGGINFTGRPSGIEFMYKNSAENTDKSTVVAYLWKGHWTQKDVPTVVYMSGEPVIKDMIDRDRCVLGMDMTGLQGGEITKTEDAELIAVLTGEISDVSEDWKKFSGKFEYKSDATPEMLNLIISAGDYFASASEVKKGNTITVDDVKLLYDADDTENYPGYLNVKIGEAPITVNQSATLEITPSGDNTCTILLPNLVLMMNETALPLGDIKVENVKTTENGGVITYEGSVKDMVLLNGALTADVKLKGTNTGGNLNMNIDVLSNGMQIFVTFTSSQSGVSTIVVDSEEAVLFNLQGMRVDTNQLTPGIYIVRQGNKASKVLVK